MSRHFAFLRGINLGKRNVKMDELREIIRELGFDNVATFLASGNLIFDSDGVDPADLERRIEGHLRQALGYDVATFVRGADQLVELASQRPFSERDREPGALNVTFLREPPGDELRAALADLETDADRFRVTGREVWWWSETNMSQSPAWTPFVRLLPDDSTMRNVRTVRRLVDRFATES